METTGVSSAHPVADVRLRPMTELDWPAVSAIYAEGIASGLATFETTLPSWADFDASRIQPCRLIAESVNVVEGSSPSNGIAGWAALSPVSGRHCYRGVAEFSIYLAKATQGRGIGGKLLAELIAQSEAVGIWTLQGTIFPENTASVRLVERFGFRLVGRRERIAWHRGTWRDTAIYERRSTAVGL